LNKKEAVTQVVNKPQVSRPFFVRKLTKAGGSRYLSITNILPKEWTAVKISVESLDKETCLLKLEKI